MARYWCLEPEKELERSKHVDDSLVPYARAAALAALRSPQNDERRTDASYYFNEDGDVTDNSTDAVLWNWIGLVGMTLYKPCSVKRAIRCIWHDLDLPYNDVPDIGITGNKPFPLIADHLEAVFARLEERKLT